MHVLAASCLGCAEVLPGSRFAPPSYACGFLLFVWVEQRLVVMSVVWNDKWLLTVSEFEFTFVCVFHVLSCSSILFLLFLLLSPALFVCCDFPSLLHCRAIACPGLSASCSICLNTDSRTRAAPNHDKHSSWLDSVDTALEGSAPGNVALKATNVACLIAEHSMFRPN